jgi:hypothetical protein
MFTCLCRAVTSFDFPCTQARSLLGRPNDKSHLKAPTLSRAPVLPSGEKPQWQSRDA